MFPCQPGIADDQEQHHGDEHEADRDQPRAAVDLLGRPDEQREAEDEQQVADDAAGERATDDLVESVVDREQRDDQLRRVAERRVQEAADARAGVAGGMLGRLADQPCERDQRQRREHEERDVVGVGRKPYDDGDRREAERCPEKPSRHGAQAYRRTDGRHA